jgi:signal peptidase I
MKQKRRVRWVVVLAVVFAVAAVAPFYWFFGVSPQSFRIPGESMFPTLMVGDRFIAEKPINPMNVKRGEIMVYKSNKNDVIYVKRVIGLPGDEIVLTGRQLFINGNLVRDSKIPQSDDPEIRARLEENDLFEESIDGNTFQVLWSKRGGTKIPEGTFKVGASEYFFLGDNRSNSLDSRMEGGVPRSDVFARPKIIFFSAGEKGLRWKRIPKRLR